MSRTFSRLVAAAAILVVGAAGLAGCGGGATGSPQPIGLMKSGDELLIFIGQQCDDAGYLTRLKIVNYDPGSLTETQPVLWEVSTSSPTLTPSVSVGKVPYQFTELTNHMADQGIGANILIEVIMGKVTSAAFNTSHVVAGRILTSTNEIVSLEEFRSDWNCR